MQSNSRAASAVVASPPSRSSPVSDAVPEPLSRVRQRMRSARARLSPAARAAHGRGIRRLGLRLRRLRASRSVAFYLPVSGEADPLPLVAELYAGGTDLYLPRIAADNTMTFLPVVRATPLRTNRFGIDEPLGRAKRGAERLDCILLPLTAFDRSGNRLGMGGGYYDRALARATRRPGRRPLLIGIGHDFQRVDSLPANPWDIPLDAVITETTLYRFRGNPR